jgi:hypothetical protein
MHFFNNRVNLREGEDIFDCDSVNLSIVEYWTITPILLFNVKDGVEYRDFNFWIRLASSCSLIYFTWNSSSPQDRR